jgi:hypothetical protein
MTARPRPGIEHQIKRGFSPPPSFPLRGSTRGFSRGVRRSALSRSGSCLAAQEEVTMNDQTRISASGRS